MTNKEKKMKKIPGPSRSRANGSRRTVLSAIAHRPRTSKSNDGEPERLIHFGSPRDGDE